jgi:hypothetical protein
MLPECHIQTAEHPIPIVVVARHVRGHLGVVIPKLGSDERSNGEMERRTNFIHGYFATRSLLMKRCRKLVPLGNVNVVSLLCIY